jgi:hypothetical protein
MFFSVASMEVLQLIGSVLTRFPWSNKPEEPSPHVACKPMDTCGAVKQEMSVARRLHFDGSQATSLYTPISLAEEKPREPIHDVCMNRSQFMHLLSDVLVGDFVLLVFPVDGLASSCTSYTLQAFLHVFLQSMRDADVVIVRTVPSLSVRGGTMKHVYALQFRGDTVTSLSDGGVLAHLPTSLRAEIAMFKAVINQLRPVDC